MKITEDVRKYAEEKGITAEDAITEGMVEKSEQFKEQGHQLHITSDASDEDTDATDEKTEAAD
jgi:phosphomethylpyrimidine synthase